MIFFLIVSRFSVLHFLIIFAKAQEARELIKNCELNLYVSLYQNYHI